MSEEKSVMCAVRVRPRLRAGKGSRVQQEEWSHTNCVSVVDDSGLILREQKQDESCRQSQFTFDYVFDEDSQQTEVYEEAVQDLVDAAVEGLNATILAYGQTGSGKTHTVLGEVRANPLEENILTPDTGLFLRVLKDVFEHRRRKEGKVHVVVCLACIEIYCDCARDLLSANPQEEMKIQMTDENVVMPTLTRVQIIEVRDVYRQFKTASARRATRATEANDSSSRSHALFMIDIIQQEITDRNPSPPDWKFLNESPAKQPQMTQKKPRAMSPGGRAASPADARQSKWESRMRPGATVVIPKNREEPPLFFSRVVLADLAGSERSGGKAGSGAQVGTASHKEMVKINSSLTALGNVVHALHEGQSHVPYRDSTLTRVLRPSFASPSSKTLLCANLSPTQLTYDESWSTLQFANKVKAMKVSNSTVAAEQQQLAFEYLETQHSQWALLADHHICHLHHEHEPVIRRFTDLIQAPYNLHRLRRKAQEKERARVIQEMLPRAHEDKKRIQAKVEARKEEEREQLKRMKDELRQEEIDKYQAEVQDLQDKIQAAEDEKQAILQRHEELDREFKKEMAQRDQLEEEHKRSDASLKQQLAAFRQRMERLDEEDTRLTEERKQKKQATADALAERRKRLGEADDDYCWGAWAHCKAQKFFLRFKAYRETQQAYYEAVRQNTGRINQALGEARKLAKYLKDAGGQKKEAAAAPPAARPSSPQ
eukprot:TRINITY_DN13247_c0_g1_i1.p1 TRINITY_DN13247_c0_g1~~TRINITY_DN13247_c0_g1_i1.p1  ORF type:complete len:714 (+),score=235.16 TRINITY_DN13247_c0_g1_i1:82-2223(+)